ncbi:DUF1573 domain-containing protein [candidate division KSB1 bacterium]
MMNKTKLLLIITIFGSFHAAFPQQKATIKFDTKTHDYGTIKEEEGSVECTFHFTNTGNTNLFLMDVRPGCGCTVAEWSKDTLPPGGKGFVSAVFNPSNRPGPFTKSITVLSNDPVFPRTVLILKGDVTPKPKTILDFYPTQIGNLRFTSNHIAFMDIYTHQKRTDTLKIYNHWDKSMNFNFSGVPEFLSVKADPVVLEAKQEGRIIVTYDARKKHDWGLNFDKFNIKSNDIDQPVKVINVSAIIKEDFSHLSQDQIDNAPIIIVEKDRYHFGQTKQGEKLEFIFVVKNEGNNDLLIRKLKPSCGCTAVNPEKMVIKKGESSNIKVIFNTIGQKGAQHKTITIITNDPKNPSVKLHIQGSVIY